MLALAAACAGMIVGGAPPARAVAAGPRFALEPVGPDAARGWFVFDARAGATLRGQIRVVNAGERAGWVRVYPVDATTGQTTGAVYRDRKDVKRGVGAWTRLSATRVRLRAHESAFVQFNVRVPRSARPGDHLGGLVVENARIRTRAEVKRGAGTFAIRIRNLTIVAVEIRVPGHRRPRMALTGLRPGTAGGRQALLLGMHNSGNVLVKGRGRLVVSDSGDRRLQSSRFALDTFVPGTGVQFPVLVTGRPLGAGAYNAVAVVRYDGHTVRRTFGFSISERQLKQVYGEPAALHAPAVAGAGRSVVTVVGGGAGVALAGFGAAALLFRRPRRSP